MLSTQESRDEMECEILTAILDSMKLFCEDRAQCDRDHDSIKLLFARASITAGTTILVGLLDLSTEKALESQATYLRELRTLWQQKESM